MIVEDSSSTFINPSQVFHHAGHEASSSRPGLQRHLSLNLAGSSAFDPPPSLSPMNLQDSSYSQAAFPASPALPQTATSIMTSSSATARPSRHKAKRSLSAGDLSQVFASARADFHHPMPAAPRPQTNNASFISKLWNMLSQTDEEHATLISFSSNGSTFVIANATEFAKTILPQHFKQ